MLQNKFLVCVRQYADWETDNPDYVNEFRYSTNNIVSFIEDFVSVYIEKDLKNMFKYLSEGDDRNILNKYNNRLDELIKNISEEDKDIVKEYLNHEFVDSFDEKFSRKYPPVNGVYGNDLISINFDVYNMNKFGFIGIWSYNSSDKIIVEELKKVFKNILISKISQNISDASENNNDIESNTTVVDKNDIVKNIRLPGTIVKIKTTKQSHVKAICPGCFGHGKDYYGDTCKICLGKGYILRECDIDKYINMVIHKVIINPDLTVEYMLTEYGRELNKDTEFAIKSHKELFGGQ